MIHEDSLLRTIGHTISRRDFLARTTGAVGVIAMAKILSAASGMLVAAYHGATAAYHHILAPTRNPGGENLVSHFTTRSRSRVNIIET